MVIHYKISTSIYRGIINNIKNIIFIKVNTTEIIFTYT